MRAEPEKSLSVFTIKIADKKENVVFNSILGGYSHIMWIRAENPSDPVVRIFTTEDLEDEASAILERMREEVVFEFVDE